MIDSPLSYKNRTTEFYQYVSEFVATIKAWQDFQFHNNPSLHHDNLDEERDIAQQVWLAHTRLPSEAFEAVGAVMIWKVVYDAAIVAYPDRDVEYWDDPETEVQYATRIVGEHCHAINKFVNYKDWGIDYGLDIPGLIWFFTAGDGYPGPELHRR